MNVIIRVGWDYRTKYLTCPACDKGWSETARALYGVVAMTYPGCGMLLGVDDKDFSGDANYQPIGGK